MNNLSTMEQVWLTMIIWFVLICVIGVISYFYNRHRKKTFDERFEKMLRGRNNSSVCQISPVKNPLPTPPERKEILLSEEEYVIPRDKIDVFRSAQNQKGRYEPNDNGIVVWNTDEKSAPWVSVDFAPPLDPPSYTSDSGSSTSDSSPTDFGGGDFGGGGAGGDY